MKNIVYFLFVIFLMSSCTSDVTIDFPTHFVKSNTVILNEEVNLKDHISESPSGYSTVTLKAGTIAVDINGKKSQIKTEKGGLLNLDKRELVAFQIYFGNNKNAWQGSFAAMVDSIVYYPKNSFLKNTPSHFVEQAKYNIKRPLDPKRAQFFEVMVIRKEDLYTEKFWDFGIAEEIPDSVEERVQNIGMGNVVKKFTVKDANYFKAYAMMANLYETVDLRAIESTKESETKETND